MSELRPSGESDGAARLAAAAQARLACGLAELRLPDAHRLTEWQRTTVAALLERLIRSVEEALRARLALNFADEDGLHASLASAHVDIAMPILELSAPWEPQLIGALLRRADEHRLHRLSADQTLLIDLAGDPDEEIASEAMALLIAQSSRFDAFQEPLLLRTELPAEIEHGLVWTIAAALRRYIVAAHDIAAVEADAAISAASTALLYAHDEGEGFGARALRLMRHLYVAGRLDDSLVLRSLTDGSLPLFLASLTARSGIDMDSAWELVSDPAGRGGALLLRAAAVDKENAAAILLRLLGRSETVAAELDRFEAVEPQSASLLLGLWHADPAYRLAVARLAS